LQLEVTYRGNNVPSQLLKYTYHKHMCLMLLWICEAFVLSGMTLNSIWLSSYIHVVDLTAILYVECSLKCWPHISQVIKKMFR